MAQLIKVDNLTHFYPEQKSSLSPALDKITMTIEEGEFVALIGANGSGKTTLARHFNALLLPTSGRVLVDGLDTREPRHRATIRNMVGMVFQHPEDQIVATTVEEDVAFGLENMGVPPTYIHCRVEEALQAVNLWEYRTRPPHLLSAGQMQRLALAGVIAMRPRCIVFDEATSLLDPLGRKDVMKILNHLQQEGVTIIFITHLMEEAACADRIVVLHRGQIVLDGSPAAIFSQANTLHELGLDLPAAATLANALRQQLPDISPGILTTPDLLKALPPFPKQPATTPANYPLAKEHSQGSDQPLIETSKLGHIYLAGTPLAHRSLYGFNLQVNEKESHGLAGPTGCGKSTLLQHLIGLLRPQEGLVRVSSFLLHDPKVDVKSLRKMVGLVFQNPEMQIFERYVGDEIAYGPRIMYGREMLRERVCWAMEFVGMNYEAYKDRLTFSLSGGERRKLALASTLALQPKVLLLDEPFAGLDPLTRRVLLGQFQALSQSGITIVFSSHNMEDVAILAKRLTLCNQGTAVLSGTVHEVFTQPELMQNLGLDLPIVIQVVNSLRARGWPIPTTIINTEALVGELRKTLAYSKR